MLLAADIIDFQRAKEDPDKSPDIREAQIDSMKWL